MPTLDASQLRRAIDRALGADVPIHITGAPGIGKTEIARGVARSYGRPMYYLELAGCAPEDLPGIPDRVDGQIVRLPIGPVRGACEVPGILFLDELSQAPLTQQSAILTGINERRLGDCALHPDTRIILASNGASEGATQEISALVWNRICTVSYRPSLADVQTYLTGLGTDGSTIRSLGADYSATLEVSPTLVQLAPPSGAQHTGTWASPRAIVKGLQILAIAQDAGDQIDTDPSVIALLDGVLSPEVAGAYLAIRRIRERLASRTEIVRDPVGARLPTDMESGIASLGVIGQVGTEHPAAAWIYADRLPLPEVRAAAGRYLMVRAPLGSAPKAQKVEAERARARILGATGAALGRAG